MRLSGGRGTQESQESLNGPPKAFRNHANDKYGCTGTYRCHSVMLKSKCGVGNHIGVGIEFFIEAIERMVFGCDCLYIPCFLQILQGVYFTTVVLWASGE